MNEDFECFLDFPGRICRKLVVDEREESERQSAPTLILSQRTEPSDAANCCLVPMETQLVMMLPLRFGLDLRRSNLHRAEFFFRAVRGPSSQHLIENKILV